MGGGRSNYPGPGSYDRNIIRDTPNWKFSNSVKDPFKPSATPGPGAYGRLAQW